MSKKHPNTERSVVSIAEETFQLHEARYKEQGMNLEADLDEMAEREAKKLSDKGLTYPKDGTPFEKWSFLSEALQKSEKEKEIEALRKMIADKLTMVEKALRSGNSDEFNTAVRQYPSFSSEILEEMELSLDTDADHHPQLREKIRETRELVGKLRKYV